MDVETGCMGLRDRLPKGSRFDWEILDGALHIALLRVPETGRGVGTLFLADVLALADAHGMPVTLEADPSLEPGDPSLFNLRRTYTRFGFVADGMTEDHWVMMGRRPRPVRAGASSVMQDYEHARSADLTRERFDDMLEGWLKDLGAPRP